jgi:cell shape-determining protein MreD
MFGAFIGLMEDILSGPLIGASFFSKGFLAFLTIQSFSGLFFRWTPLLGVIVISALTFLDNVIILGFRMIFSESSMNIMPYLKMIFIQIITNLPFGIIIKPKLNK